MICTFKHVESVQGTHLHKLSNGIMFSQYILNNGTLLKTFLDNGKRWESYFPNGTANPSISENENHVNIHNGKALGIIDKKTGELLCNIEQKISHIRDNHFIKYERIGEDRKFLKMLCYNFDACNVQLSWVINETERGSFISYISNLFMFIKNKLRCINISNGKELWQLDLGDLGSYTDEFSKQAVNGRIEGLIVVDDNILVTSVHRFGILGISLQTGEILWQVTNIQNVVLNEGILYSFSDYYYEIDAISGKTLKQEDYKTLFKENNFRPYWLTKPAIAGNLIAIASHYDNAIILINRIDFLIIERLDLGNTFKGIPLTNTPQIHQNRLYQLDGDNTLHIFEREGDV